MASAELQPAAIGLPSTIAPLVDTSVPMPIGALFTRSATGQLAITTALGSHSSTIAEAPPAVPLTMIVRPAPGNIVRPAAELRTLVPVNAWALVKLAIRICTMGLAVRTLLNTA